MGFGVKEPKTHIGEHVPGTATIYSERENAVIVPQAGVKRGHGSNSEVILVPQPSESPNDPLNWPQWKKNLTFFSICLSVSMGGVLGPIVSPITGVIAQEMHVPISRAALASGYPLMTTALGGFIAQAWAPILGKRSFYLISTTILFTSSVWTLRARSFNSFLGARTFQGFGTGAYESIVISSIGDMYFLHERGRKVLFYNVVSFGTSNLSPIIGGYISTNYGWRMQFKIMTGFTALALIFMFFFGPETTYARAVVYETDMRSTEGIPFNAEKETKTTTESELAVSSESPPLSATLEKPKTYLKELKIFNGLYSRQNPLVLLARPFACFLYPAVFWGFTVGGLWTSWAIGLSIVLAQIFGAPPNNFNPTKLGFLYTFPLIFLLFGCLLGVFLTDWWPKWCARRNHGIFEPEFRLILLIPVLLVGVPGLFAFGYYASRSDVSWMAASCLQGMICFAAVLSGTVSIGYILDCYRSRSIEVTVAMLMLRNFFWFGASYFLPQWLEKEATWKVFDVIGSLQLGITLCSVFVYVYGKRLRKFFHEHDPLRLFHLV